MFYNQTSRSFELYKLKSTSFLSLDKWNFKCTSEFSSKASGIRNFRNSVAWITIRKIFLTTRWRAHCPHRGCRSDCRCEQTRNPSECRSADHRRPTRRRTRESILDDMSIVRKEWCTLWPHKYIEQSTRPRNYQTIVNCACTICLVVNAPSGSEETGNVGGGVSQRTKKPHGYQQASTPAQRYRPMPQVRWHSLGV